MRSLISLFQGRYMIHEQSDQFLDLNNFSNRTEHTGDFIKYGISHRKPQSQSKATGKDSRDQRYTMALNSLIKTVCIEIC